MRCSIRHPNRLHPSRQPTRARCTVGAEGLSYVMSVLDKVRATGLPQASILSGQARRREPRAADGRTADVHGVKLADRGR